MLAAKLITLMIFRSHQVLYTAAIGWSKKAHAIIKKINLDEVIKSEGVVTVVVADDIIGRNDVGPVYDGDPIFPKKAEYYGQPLYAVACNNNRTCKEGGLKGEN
jgi:xanthine dehydrogenase large subunit